MASINNYVGWCLCCFLGLEKSSLIGIQDQEMIYSIDLIFAILFTIEIIIRILAEKNFLNFFVLFKIENKKLKPSSEGFWNVFDLILVVGSIGVLMFYTYDHLEFVYIARILRVGRIFRLFEISDRLKQIEFQIISVFPTIMLFVLLLSILLYSYAIVGTHLFGHFPEEPELMSYFGSTESSLITVIQLVTLDGWADILNVCMKHHSIIGALYCLSFIFQIVIIFLNVFIAVLVKNVEESMDITKTEENTDKILILENRILKMEEEIKAKEDEMIEILNRIDKKL